MGVNKVGSFAPGDEDINNIMIWINYNALGRDRVSLTNWTNSSQPSIAAGSIIEAGGSLYEVTTDTAITGSPSDGDVYIKITPSGDTASFSFVNSAPSWDSEKFGYYDTSTDNKILLIKMFKTGSSWIRKTIFDPEGRIYYMNSIETQTDTSSVTIDSTASKTFTFSQDVQGVANLEVRRTNASNDWLSPISYNYSVSGAVVTVDISNSMFTDIYDYSGTGTLSAFCIDNTAAGYSKIDENTKIVKCSDGYFYFNGSCLSDTTTNNARRIPGSYNEVAASTSLSISVTAFI